MNKQEKRISNLQSELIIETFMVAAFDEDPDNALMEAIILVQALAKRFGDNISNWRKYKGLSNKDVKLALIEQARTLLDHIDREIDLARGGLK